MKLDFTKPLYALAPLAGFTDLPFRYVAKKFGADLTVSEMISSNALAFDSKKTLKMLEKNEIENPYTIQLAGSDQEIMRRAVEKLNEREGINAIDLNCGCPAPKIVNNLQGSSLLNDLGKMGETIETIKRYSNKEYTSVKIRLGFNDKNHKEIAKICENSGADYIAVHGRTRAGKYKAQVDYDAIREIKETVNIPVIANGDITSIEKANWVLNHTKADGVMIGRGAVGNPWIFHQIKTGNTFVSSSLRKEVILQHYEQMLKHYGEFGAVMFRKHLHTYSKAGYDGASLFRNKVNNIKDENEMRDVIESFFSQEFNGIF